MNVLSLFDGISCGQQSLKSIGVKVDNYYASEIEQFSIDVTNKNFPNTIQLGDINNYQSWNLPKIDLIIGGSPCQGFSMAGKQLNFDDIRSKLFFKFVDCINYFEPDYFLLENVKMKKEYVKVINSYLGETPFLLKSCYFNLPQHRPRLFWSDIPLLIEHFDNTKLTIKDILEYDDVNNSNNIILKEKIGKSKLKAWNNLPITVNDLNFRKSKNNIYNMKLINTSCGGSNFPDNILLKSDGIYSTLCTTYNFQSMILTPNNIIRHLTIIEEERLQGLPDNYTSLNSTYKNETKLRKKALGNCWSINVINYILEFFKNIKKEEL